MMGAFVKYGNSSLDARYHHNDRAVLQEAYILVEKMSSLYIIQLDHGRSMRHRN